MVSRFISFILDAPCQRDRSKAGKSVVKWLWGSLWLTH